jgi:MFS superfamily sulfate permease-like transporter
MKSQLALYREHIRQDFPASIVVFLVALPLCLGIALASGAPLFSGIIAGVVGGLVVSWASGSQLSVSGPAAGLTVIVLNAIESLGSFQGFLLSVVLAGVLQMALGYARAGLIGAFFPASVIKGMLSAIGLILIMKQLPHAAGFDRSLLSHGEGGFMHSLSAISPGATMVSVVSLLILIAWESPIIKRFSALRLVPGPLLAVLWGVGYNSVATAAFPEWSVGGKYLVSLPELSSASQFFNQLQLPDFSYFGNPLTYKVAATLAIIASLETLLSVEAVDKLDPHKRVAPTNRELKAQGLGNILSGMLGGLPMTAVIVRSSANINAGGQTRISCFLHGLMLLISVLFFATAINTIPLACLAAILLQTGYKLAKPALFISFYRKGWSQFLPFLITVVAILLTDLLQGIVIGIAVGIGFVLRANFHEAISLTVHGNHAVLRLHKDVSFLNKALLRKQLDSIANDSQVLIDGTRAVFVDHDIMETLADFMAGAPDRGISVNVEGLTLSAQAAAGH